MFIHRKRRSLSLSTDAFFNIQNKNKKNYTKRMIQTFRSEWRYKRSIFDLDPSLFIACKRGGGGSEDYGVEYGQCVCVCVGGKKVGITRHQQSIKGDYRNLTANQLEEELGSEQ